MSPKICNGDYVISCKWPGMKVTRGMVVIVDHLRFGKIIKRVKQRNNVGALLLTGENAQRTSTEQLGWVHKKEIYGRVILHLKRKQITHSSPS